MMKKNEGRAHILSVECWCRPTVDYYGRKQDIADSRAALKEYERTGGRDAGEVLQEIAAKYGPVGD